MMRNLWKSSGCARLVAVGVLVTATTGVTFAQNPPQKCGGADIATGPFAYSNYGTGSATFNGTVPGTVTTGFTVAAPAPSPDNPLVPNVFAGQGQNACLGEALADIGVIEIDKVGDAQGLPLDPTVSLDIDSGLGQQIAAAFSLTPNSYLFTPGDSTAVTVVVSNPGVSADDYGDYIVKLGAKAPGAGIGVGPGPLFTLSLRPVTAVDTTPPVVTVTKPAGDEILGVIGIEVQAYDPAGPAASGLASISASISSSGGVVSNVNIPLTPDATLPVAPGVTVTAVGTYAPVGGSPSDTSGTTEALAFTASSRSGIGTYVINATATDVAGNPGGASKTFNVNYQVAFTRESSTNPCQSGGNSSCTGQFAWTVNRSSITSDGAPMWDKTVVAKLRRVSDDVVVATHFFGTGDIKDVVQIGDDVVYKSNFRRGDVGGSGPTGYRVDVYFLNVDGVLMLQATSNTVTF
jgi:hypothetical protein